MVIEVKPAVAVKLGQLTGFGGTRLAIYGGEFALRALLSATGQRFVPALRCRSLRVQLRVVCLDARELLTLRQLQSLFASGDEIDLQFEFRTIYRRR